jgi:hypothetical protein
MMAYLGIFLIGFGCGMAGLLAYEIRHGIRW